MTFPISRISAPGLQILIDSSRHFLAVRMSRSESSSIRPTGYVSFKSPWKPSVQDYSVLENELNLPHHRSTTLRLAGKMSRDPHVCDGTYLC
jgi:hypothetical protein